MREIQLYVGNKRLDLFGDESIEITSSIQDAKDISKVFTDYSKTFDVPASTENNKIFKHFYNFNITSGAFDARVRHVARIEINHMPFKKGKIFLNGVTMNDNKPHMYNVTFFGNTVSLKDIFGDDKLIALNNYTGETLGLNNFDHEYSYTSIKDIFSSYGLQKFSDSSALIYPLITSKKRLFYDSTISNTDLRNFDGNIYAPSSGYDVDRYRKRGVKPEDLKPAIKVYHIIKAIQEKYNLNFIPDDTPGTKDFFSKENEAFANLYLWLSNSSGNITGELADDEYIYKQRVTSWTQIYETNNIESDNLSVDGEDLVIKNFEPEKINIFGENPRFVIEVHPDSSYLNVKYRIRFIDKETGRFQTFHGVGQQSNIKVSVPDTLTSPIFQPFEGPDRINRYAIEIYSETPMVNTNIKFKYAQPFRQVFPPLTYFKTETYESGASITAQTAEITIANHLPDIKIIDFMSGLFKMFNLTAFYIDDETDPEYSSTTPVVKVMTLDNYFADAVNNTSKGTIDVSKYIDINEHVVNTALPFSEIDFKFEKTDSILMENHLQTNGEVFGDSHLPVQSLYPEFFFGEKYEIKVPFSKLKYERINGKDTEIQWGYAAGGDFNSEEADYSNTNDIVPPKGDYNSISIKPLLFYGVKQDSIAQNINFSDDSNTVVSLVNNYYRPSNTNENDVANTDAELEGDDNFFRADFMINFDSEIDEFELKPSFNSLFHVFYRNYVESVFDPSKRIFEFKAFLPASFLIHYRLNDQLKIQDTIYRINSITTNLNTGESSLELINLKSDEVV